MLGGAAALAQSPPGEQAAASVDAQDLAPPCVTAGGRPPQDGEREGDAQEAVPCEEQAPQDIPADAVEDAFADAEDNELKTTGDDVTAQEEFETGEEISEDFAVPLPADI